MKYSRLTLGAVLAVLSIFLPFVVNAETVSNYTVDFNTPIVTSDPTFKVASNWKHIAHKYNDGYSDYYMSYTYKDAGGHSGGYLQAYNQRAGDNWDYETTYDLLVTPIVSGEVSLWVKLYQDSNSYVEFYSLNEAGTGRDQLLAKFSSTSTPKLTTTGWTKVSITVDDPQRIGIRACYALIDDFSAYTAEIEVEKSMKIETAVPSETTGVLYWDQQLDGSVPVVFTVTVTNNGPAKIFKGDKGYSVSIINRKTEAALGVATPVPFDLEIGATSPEFEVKAVIPQDQISSYWAYASAIANFDLKENLGQSVVKRAGSMYRPYEPKFVFRQAGTTSTTNINGKIDFGVITQSSIKNYEIYNDGVAPLTIKSVSLPEGFTTNIGDGEFVVAKKSSSPLSITLPDSQKGSFSGNLAIVYLDKTGKEITYTIPISGSVTTEGTWIADFNNPANSSTVKYPDGSIAQSGITSSYESNSGVYNVYLSSFSDASFKTANNLFITPLLHAKAGDVMSFQVAKGSGSDNFVKVYVSSDRENWGEPKASFSTDLTSSFVSKSITFDEEGDIYVAFGIYNAYLDNIIGLSKVDVAHDLFITNFNQPDVIQTGVSISPSLTFIPLTKERQSAYNIVYYMDGKAKASVSDRLNLEPSAKDSKSFSVSVSPTTETTTTYQTYFQVEFLNGPTFKSPVRELTVTCEPEFIFINKGTTTSSRPTTLTSPIKFGTSNQLGKTKEYTIFNWGMAPLTVTSIELPQGFASNIESATVPSKEGADLIITFSATEPGIYEGDMVITYKDAQNEDVQFTLPVSGTLLDPAKWYVSFDETSSGSWPAGSLHESKVSLTNIGDSSNYNFALNSSVNESEATPNNLFISPLLHAEAGETISFDAKIYSSYWSEGKVVVYSATSREALSDPESRTLLISLSGESTGDSKLTQNFNTYTVTMPQTGDFYIGFQIFSRAYVDNIYGLSPVNKSLDLYIASQVFPTGGMQNLASRITVNVLNLSTSEIKAGSYTLNSYLGDKKTSVTGTVDIPVSNTLSADATQLTFTVMSPDTGTFPVSVEIVKDDESILWGPKNITFTEEEAVGEVTVGEVTGLSSDCPINTNYKNSETIAIYSPELLGLSDGARISSIVFKGFSTQPSSKKISDLSVYYDWDNTSLSKPSSSTAFDISGMTPGLIMKSREWNAIGSEKNLVDMIEVVFDEPIVYHAGKSLRILVRNVSDSYYSGARFETTSLSGSAYYHRNDGTTGTFTDSWRDADLPAIHLKLVVEPKTVTGIVTSGGQPVSNAAVRFASTDGSGVQYSATTGNDGKYSVNIIQSTRIYNVTVMNADSSKGRIVKDVAPSDSQTLDIELVDNVIFNDETQMINASTDAMIQWDVIYPAGFNAVVFPFDLDSDEVEAIFGEDTVIHDFAGDTGVGSVTAQFAQRSNPGITAGVPCLVYSKMESAPATFSDKTIVATPRSVAGTNLEFMGVFTPTAMKAGMFPLTIGNFTGGEAPARANSKGILLPFRAIIHALNNSVNYVSFNTDADIKVETGIEDLESDNDTNEPIYNLQGIQVINPTPGIYIRGGKKIVIK